jgi:hypothetical protein
MTDPIIYIDTSDILEGKIETLRAAVLELAAFIEVNNPRILSYRFFIDEDAARMTVVAVHPDSKALEFHMDVGDAEFCKFADLVDLSSITVYGEVSQTVLEHLDRKARMLGHGRVSVHRSQAGFSR